MENNLEWSEFERVDMRVGTILSAEVFKEARNPAYILHIDFGSLGIRKTSAQITVKYQPKDLVGRQVIAVVNFPAKQIANIQSECLVLGAIDGLQVTLLAPDSKIPNGLRIG